jgi:hypothetical protein
MIGRLKTVRKRRAAAYGVGRRTRGSVIAGGFGREEKSAWVEAG